MAPLLGPFATSAFSGTSTTSFNRGSGNNRPGRIADGPCNASDVRLLAIEVQPKEKGHSNKKTG